MTDYLLDSHLLVWAAQNNERLPRKCAALIEDPANTLYFSAVNFCEISIKAALGKPWFVVEPAELRRSLLKVGYLELTVTSEHAIAVMNLPPIHKDPFDRLLVAQAQVEGITLLTVDRTLAGYPGPIRRF